MGSVLTSGQKTSMLVFGALVLAVAAGLLAWGRTPGASTTTTTAGSTTVVTVANTSKPMPTLATATTTTPAITTKALTEAPSPASASAAATGAAAARTVTTVGGSRVKVTTTTLPGNAETITTAHPTIVTTKPGHAAIASDSLIVLLVTAGLALVLGALVPGITKIGFFGNEIDLSPAARAQLDTHVRQRVGDDPQVVAKALRIAHASLGADYWGKIATPPDEDLQRAADAAAKAVNVG